MTVEQFFTRYAALSMGDDDRALAAVYAPSFFVAGPTGSMTFANDAQFLDWLARPHVQSSARDACLVARSTPPVAALRKDLRCFWRACCPNAHTPRQRCSVNAVYRDNPVVVTLFQHGTDEEHAPRRSSPPSTAH